jgi:hypothetical protein
MKPMNSSTPASNKIQQKLKQIHEMKVLAKPPRQCEHIKPNGEFCGSPALHGRNYCYFHLTIIGRRIRAARSYEAAMARMSDTPAANSKTPNIPLELPPLEDANSIQIALMQVVDAILNDRLDTKRAGLVLYALQTASSNLARGADFRQSDGATVAGSYEQFEQDFEVGDDMPDLKVDHTQVDEDEHEAKIKQIEEMAEAYAKLDTARDEAEQKLNSAGQLDAADNNPSPHCAEVDQFFCTIMGPLSQTTQAYAQPGIIERRALSQRLDLAPISSPRSGRKNPSSCRKKKRAA